MGAKALEACVKYEQARKEILNLTKAIGEAAEVKCADYRSNSFLGTACIERLWDHNKAAKDYAEWAADEELYGQEAGEEPEGPEETGTPTLCKRCAQVNDLVQRRKQAKKTYGIAKRRVSAIGRAKIA